MTCYRLELGANRFQDVASINEVELLANVRRQAGFLSGSGFSSAAYFSKTHQVLRRRSKGPKELEQLVDGGCMRPVEVVQDHEPFPICGFEIVDQSSGDLRQRWQRRQGQELAGRFQPTGSETIQRGPKIAEKDREVPIALV